MTWLTFARTKQWTPPPAQLAEVILRSFQECGHTLKDIDFRQVRLTAVALCGQMQLLHKRRRFSAGLGDRRWSTVQSRNSKRWSIETLLLSSLTRDQPAD
jgi:hypothetical protein